MLKARPLCNGVESNLGDRVLGEVAKNSFIDLPSKGGHGGLVPLKTVCPNLAGFGEEFFFFKNLLNLYFPNCGINKNFSQNV